jgi:hypothetical protein
LNGDRLSERVLGPPTMVCEPGPHGVLAVASFLPDREFRRFVARYDGDARLRGFSCWDQYLTMAFAQLTYREMLQ